MHGEKILSNLEDDLSLCPQTRGECNPSSSVLRSMYGNARNADFNGTRMYGNVRKAGFTGDNIRASRGGAFRDGKDHGRRRICSQSYPFHTHKSAVQCSGFVESRTDMTKAVEAARRQRRDVRQERPAAEAILAGKRRGFDLCGGPGECRGEIHVRPMLASARTAPQDRPMIVAHPMLRRTPSCAPIVNNSFWA